MDTIAQALVTLDIPYPARAVYQDLLEVGGSTPAAIAKRLRMTRPSVYDQLKRLETHGLVGAMEVNGKSRFGALPVKQLQRLLTERAQEVDAVGLALSALGAQVPSATTVTPVIRFFEGKEGIAQLLNELLWNATKTIYTVWPHTHMERAVGQAALDAFNKKRIKQRIRIESVWTEQVPKSGYVWEGGDDGVTRRFAPKGYTPPMGFAVSGDTTMFLSTARESFGFLVTSRDVAGLMKAQFELVWGNADRTLRQAQGRRRTTQN